MNTWVKNTKSVIRIQQDGQKGIPVQSDRKVLLQSSAGGLWPIPTEWQNQWPTHPQYVSDYNGFAEEVMIDCVIAINGYCRSMLSNFEAYSMDGTHFSEAGKLVNGSQIVSAIYAVITLKASSAALLSSGMFL